MSETIRDHKNKPAIAFVSWLNRLVLKHKFSRIDVNGSANIPAEGPFLLVSNHTSRWDGLLIYRLLSRPANYMVSPNEPRGWQGAVLKSNGGFPADGRLDLSNFILQQIAKGEPVVIFPEGNVFRDGSIHAFKKGAAKFAWYCFNKGVNLPMVPFAIGYSGSSVSLEVAEPIDPSSIFEGQATTELEAVNRLTKLMHERVCHARKLIDQRNAFDKEGNGEPGVCANKSAAETYGQVLSRFLQPPPASA
jgi:1-acyl-sn-glycerol-3-phosphate acyltransferase